MYQGKYISLNYMKIGLLICTFLTKSENKDLRNNQIIEKKNYVEKISS
jgi:hypothetical protein